MSPALRSRTARGGCAGNAAGFTSERSVECDGQGVATHSEDALRGAVHLDVIPFERIDVRELDRDDIPEDAARLGLAQQLKF